MVRLISEREPIARKVHNCMSCEFLRMDGNLRSLTFTFSEWRAIIKARKNNFKIVKGQKYINQRNVMDGTIYTFKAIPEIHAICIKYDYYVE